jgi:hypothetical protein
MENLLLASSSAIDQVSPLVLRLPVEPALGNYYEVGVTKSILGRVRPSYSVNVGAGFDLYEKKGRTLSLQLQGSNLTNHLNVINFTSLFSGAAIATPSSFGIRLNTSF